MSSNVPAIVAEKLNKSYDGARGIIDLDLQVEAGEVFGFLGPNGAGKTTTIRILMDLIRPTGGRASIFGLGCQEKAVEIKALTGYLPGELSLWNNLTGRQNLVYMANLRGGVPMNTIEEYAKRLGLDLDRKFREYSKGNKQKVGIVQAFMHKPKLLILDEPTGGLDPLNQQEFFHMVADAHAAGATIFLSSHILSEVEHTCDRVGIIREGRMVRVGTVSDVIADKHYSVVLTLGVPITDQIRNEFEALPNVENVTTSDHSLSFVVQGDIDSVMKMAAGYPVISISSHEPTLEEAFLQYYRG